MNISWVNPSSHRFQKKGDVRSSTGFRSHYSLGDTFQIAFRSIFCLLAKIRFCSNTAAGSARLRDADGRNNSPIYTETTAADTDTQLSRASTCML